MAQSLSKILLHTVFSTKDRRTLLRDKPLREELHRYLGGIVTNVGCQPVIVGGVEDHVHLLFALSRTCTVADVVKELKRKISFQDEFRQLLRRYEVEFGEAYVWD